MTSTRELDKVLVSYSKCSLAAWLLRLRQAHGGLLLSSVLCRRPGSGQHAACRVHPTCKLDHNTTHILIATPQ